MTTLAEAIAAAHNDWCKRKPDGIWRDHIAAAVVAWMQTPDVAMKFKEALLDAIQADDGGAMIATEQPWTSIDCHVQLDVVIKAAIAALTPDASGKT